MASGEQPDPFQTYWDSKPKAYRKKWATRMDSGLSPKRKFQLLRHMAEFFARQKGPEMEKIAKAKRDEFQKQLELCEKDVQRLEMELGYARQNREQLRGAVAAVDKIFAAAANPTGKPELRLIPSPEPEKAPDPVPEPA